MKSIPAPSPSPSQINWKQVSLEALVSLNDDLHKQADEVSLFIRMLEKAAAAREALKDEVPFQKGRFRGLVEAIEALDLLTRKIHPNLHGGMALLPGEPPLDPNARAKNLAELQDFSKASLSITKTPKGDLQLEISRPAQKRKYHWRGGKDPRKQPRKDLK